MNEKKTTTTAAETQKNSHTQKFEIFGSNLRIMRKEMGYTTATLAKFLDLSVAYVGLIERGDRTPSTEMLLKICDLLGVGVDEMLIPKFQNQQVKPRQNQSESKIERKQKSTISMIKTFDEAELDYIVTILTNLKDFRAQKR